MLGGAGSLLGRDGADLMEVVHAGLCSPFFCLYSRLALFGLVPAI